jgi:hypothetical protein
METIRAIFVGLDPRDQNARHDFSEMLFISIAAMLCGARNCSDIWRFAHEKEAMLREALTLAHGIPSHDTFSALFRKLVPTAFAAAFTRFMSWAVSRRPPVPTGRVRVTHSRRGAVTPPVSLFACGSERSTLPVEGREKGKARLAAGFEQARTRHLNPSAGARRGPRRRRGRRRGPRAGCRTCGRPDRRRASPARDCRSPASGRAPACSRNRA